MARRAVGKWQRQVKQRIQGGSDGGSEASKDRTRVIHGSIPPSLFRVTIEATAGQRPFGQVAMPAVRARHAAQALSD